MSAGRTRARFSTASQWCSRRSAGARHPAHTLLDHRQVRAHALVQRELARRLYRQRPPCVKLVQPDRFGKAELLEAAPVEAPADQACAGVAAVDLAARVDGDVAARDGEQFFAPKRRVAFDLVEVEALTVVV